MAVLMSEIFQNRVGRSPARRIIDDLNQGPLAHALADVKRDSLLAGSYLDQRSFQEAGNFEVRCIGIERSGVSRNHEY